ncbi:MAG: energy transducer TonB [Chitinophagales bacterium]
MKSLLILLFFFGNETLFAQTFVLYSSRWSDVGSRSSSNTHSVIYIDSTRITVEQGTSHLYLDIKEQHRNENNFLYTVLDADDAECHAVFSPEQMTFDYQSGEYHLRYFIDSLQQQQPQTEESSDESAAANDSTANDTTAKEDNKIYLSAETPPEFPGGDDAMKTWLIENVKYPAAAKRDKLIGLVELTAVVEKNGSLSNIEVKHDIGGGCGDEAIRAVKTMPTWIPGQIKGEDKRVKVTIKIFFPPK